MGKESSNEPKDLKEITDFYYVKDVRKNNSKKGEYLQIKLANASEEITGIVWQAQDKDIETFKEKAVVKIKGTIKEFNEATYIDISQSRLATEKDGCDELFNLAKNLNKDNEKNKSTTKTETPTAPAKTEKPISDNNSKIRNNIKANEIKNELNGIEVVAFYLVKAVNQLQTKTNNPYLYITLMDNTGEIIGKVWDASSTDIELFKVGAFVKINGTIELYNDKPYIKITKSRLATEEDGLNPQEFIASAPLDIDTMYNEILERIDQIEDEDYKKIVHAIFTHESFKEKCYYPAGQIIHHAVRGGLLYHIYRMIKLADKIVDVYPIAKKDLLIAGVIIHDIGKIKEMEVEDVSAVVTGYTFEGQLIGHIGIGMMLIETFAEKLKIDTIKKMQLQHLIIAHHGTEEHGSPKKPIFIEAQLLHYVDLIDSHVYIFEDNLKSLEGPGQFTNKIWAIQTPITIAY